MFQILKNASYSTVDNVTLVLTSDPMCSNGMETNDRSGAEENGLIKRPNYKSLANPINFDRASGQRNLARYLKQRSESARDVEKKQLLNSTRDFDASIQREQDFCPICTHSITMLHMEHTAIYHKHRSLRMDRIRMKFEDDGSYPCTLCFTLHSADLGARKAVVVGDSLLAGWEDAWVEAERSTKSHFDIIAIKGASIPVLNQAYLAEYGKEERPVDVVLLAGLQDLREDKTPGEILRSIDTFKMSVLGLSGKPINTFALCLLPVPPSSNLPVMVKNVEEVNRGMININREIQQNAAVHHAPSFFSFGRHCRKGKWLPPREDQWIGEALIPSETLKIVGNLEKYFNDIYEIEKGKRTDAKQDDTELKAKFGEEEKKKKKTERALPKATPVPPASPPKTYAEHRRRKAESLRVSTLCLGPLEDVQRKKIKMDIQVNYVTDKMTSVKTNNDRALDPNFRKDLKNYVAARKNPTANK